MAVYRIGIDVGGTNTDAVLLDQDNRVLAKVKSPTTEDVETGIRQALRHVVVTADVSSDYISYTMLGTTQCTNAVAQRKGLDKVAVIRIGAPATLAIKPLIDVPQDLRKALGSHSYIIRGGHEFDGQELAPLDEQELYRIAHKIGDQVESIAITSVFSPVSREHEERAKEILINTIGENTPISLSSEIGSIGLLERENATILNAALITTARRAINGFINALHKEDINAKVFFGQNDGTLMSVDYTLKYPIYTIACGPTNSLRGASYLGGLQDAIVVDVGGTTTDIGVLAQSFPRESSMAVEIGGVRTNFRMPDLISVSLGGGTIIRLYENNEFTIGPDSVGYQLDKKSRIFGGDVLTATDVVVALGLTCLGGADEAALANLDRALLLRIYAAMVSQVEEAIDRMKTSSLPVPVVLVGGGSILLPNTLEGVSDVIRADHSSVANAFGSAIAQVSGQIEKIVSLDEMDRGQALSIVRSEAENEAVLAGADRDSVTIVDMEDVPLAYLPGNATRIRIKAAGELAG